jgi:hypothetical protein
MRLSESSRENRYPVEPATETAVDTSLPIEPWSPWPLVSTMVRAPAFSFIS